MLINYIFSLIALVLELKRGPSKHHIQTPRNNNTSSMNKNVEGEDQNKINRSTEIKLQESSAYSN